APFTPVVRTRPAPMAKAHIAPSALQNADITTLYRVIECAVTGKAFDVQPQEAEPTPVRQTPAAVVEAAAVPAKVKVEQPREEDVAVQVEAEATSARAARSVEITMPAPRAPALPRAGRVAQVASGDAYE